MGLWIGFEDPYGGELFSQNITHNLVKMAEQAGIYGIVWRPEENGIESARDLIEPLTTGIVILMRERERFEAFNPANGWGSYDGFVPWLLRLLEAAWRNPDAAVRTSS